MVFSGGITWVLCWFGSPKYWGYNLQQILEIDVQTPLKWGVYRALLRIFMGKLTMGLFQCKSQQNAPDISKPHRGS